MFSTGSSTPYTVTTGGLSKSLLVSGDRVAFGNFTNGDNGYYNNYGGAFAARAGAVVIVGANSSLDYRYLYDSAGGDVGVDRSILVNLGSVSGGTATVSNHGLLVDSGTGASVLMIDGVSVDAGSAMLVLDGAKYQNYQTSDTLDGRVVVDGLGSSASIPVAGGAGSIEVQNNATAFFVAINPNTIGLGIGDGGAITVATPLYAGNLVTFNGEGGTLTLDGGPGGNIAGFDRTDALLVPGALTNVVWTAGAGGNGSLSLYDGTTLVETQAIQGNYKGDAFRAAATGTGTPPETKITVQGPMFLLSPAPNVVSAGAGNATLNAGGGGFTSLSPGDAGSGGAGNLGSTAAVGAGTPAYVEPAAYIAAFDQTHSLSDGTTISFVHATH